MKGLAATFIAYNYNTPVDVAAFEREAKRILREVEEECGWMYKALHVEPASSSLIKKLDFEPCAPFQATNINYRKDNLPHIQAAGTTYFIDFRTHNFRTLTEKAKRIVLDAICYWDHQRWKIFSAVVMPDHVHLMARPLKKVHDNFWVMPNKNEYMINMKQMDNIAKPFIKWAGGKSQLLSEIDNAIPDGFKQSDFIYIEPFVGGGAVLFWILQKYPNIKKAVIHDINTDLINSYRALKENVEDVIEVLSQLEKKYYSLVDKLERKKEYYYSKRYLFNSGKSELTIQTALFIFLNRTCFNGLYRVNRKNEFNVPIGSYKKPMICDEDNLRAVSNILQKAVI